MTNRTISMQLDINERVHTLALEARVTLLDALRDLRQIDALERIRSHPASRDVPVILLTDSVEAGDLERAQELGVLDLLIKSRATRQTLPKTLSRLLEHRSDSPGNGSDTSRPRSTDSA